MLHVLFVFITLVVIYQTHLIVPFVECSLFISFLFIVFMLIVLLFIIFFLVLKLIIVNLQLVYLSHIRSCVFVSSLLIFIVSLN